MSLTKLLECCHDFHQDNTQQIDTNEHDTQDGTECNATCCNDADHCGTYQHKT